ncbi:MAG TPA: OmpA family protein [Longimicrobiales bacterium]|nr:OmpA family protein [Longimicrobiales bacterium]
MLHRAALCLLIAALPLAACSRRQPPAEATPEIATRDTAAERRDRERLEQMRRDSIAAADRAAREAAEREITARATSVLEEMVFFDYDISELRPDAQTALGRKVPILRANPNLRLEIAGHADERGSLEYNLALGMRRAQSVKDYLAGFGIDAARLTITSYGEDRPLDEGSGEDAWARNRRAEFVITAGGSPLTLPGS